MTGITGVSIFTDQGYFLSIGKITEVGEEVLITPLLTHPFYHTLFEGCDIWNPFYHTLFFGNENLSREARCARNIQCGICIAQFGSACASYSLNCFDARVPVALPLSEFPN